MTADERRALLATCGDIHRELTRVEGRLAHLPARLDAFDETLHRARWERPPPRRDLDDRLAGLDRRIARIERGDDRDGPEAP